MLVVVAVGGGMVVGVGGAQLSLNPTMGHQNRFILLIVCAYVKKCSSYLYRGIQKGRGYIYFMTGARVYFSTHLPLDWRSKWPISQNILHLGFSILLSLIKCLNGRFGEYSAVRYHLVVLMVCSQQ